MSTIFGNWQNLSLIARVRRLRFLLPPLLALWVVTYQLGFAQALEAAYGHTVHYGVEIAFYSLAGPAVTWITLVWVERKLHEKDQLERQVRAAQQEKTAVLEEERARIARDLHDGVAQTLYFLALKTDLLRSKIASDTRAVAELREMGQTARQVIREVRRTIFALRPLDWRQGEFLTALQEFIAGFAEQVGWQTAVHIDTGIDVPPALQPTLYRLVQESLNNVAKHAGAKKVWIHLIRVKSGHWLQLVVRDDGQGFDPENSGIQGLGLMQMKRRVEAAAGFFGVESEPGAGTVVSAEIPLFHEDDDHE